MQPVSSKPFHFFVIGLCLQGNKGGQALALSLIQVLRGRYPNCEFTFSVPAAELVYEAEWAKRLGPFLVCNQIAFRSYLDNNVSFHEATQLDPKALSCPMCQVI